MPISASWALQLKYLEHENRRNIKGTALEEQGRRLKVDMSLFAGCLSHQTLLNIDSLWN